MVSVGLESFYSSGSEIIHEMRAWSDSNRVQEEDGDIWELTRSRKYIDGRMKDRRPVTLAGHDGANSTVRFRKLLFQGGTSNDVQV